MKMAVSGTICAVLIIAVISFSLFPVPTLAQGSGEKVLVYFFSGLCVPGRPDSCVAKQQADGNISPKLPPGATLVSPILNDGNFRNAGELNQALSQIGGNKIVFIAFSAGNKALWEMVSKMNDQQKMQVKSMISLEAKYSGWTNAVNAVRRVNPKVDVREFGAGQFGTNHDRMPGNGGIADAIAQITTAAQNDTIANLSPDVFNNRQQVQVQYNPNLQQQVQNQLSQLYRPNPATQFSYLPMPTLTSQFQQAYQPATTPQQISNYVQNTPQPSLLLTSALTDLQPISNTSSSSSVTFSSVLIEQDTINESIDSSDERGGEPMISTGDIVSVVVNPQNVTPISASTFRSADLAGTGPGSLSGFQSNNAIIVTLQTIMRSVVNLLQNIVASAR